MEQGRLELVLKDFLRRGQAAQAAVDEILSLERQGAAKDVGPDNSGTAASKQQQSRR